MKQNVKNTVFASLRVEHCSNEKMHEKYKPVYLGNLIGQSHLYHTKSILTNQIALFEGYNGSYFPACEASADASKPANQIRTHHGSHVAVQQGDLLGSKIQLRSSFMDAPDLYDLEEFDLDKKQKPDASIVQCLNTKSMPR